MSKKETGYQRPQCEVIFLNMGRAVALNIDKSENTGDALVRGEQEWDIEEDFAREPVPLHEFRNVWKEEW